jgi:hypothetical protein|tara:strand:+ start:574 stop:885 length:312 start_codon:yes stop_codon:yes gene_type:complete
MIKKIAIIFLFFLQSCINVGEEIKPSPSIAGKKDKCIFKQNEISGKIVRKIVCSEKYQINITEGYDNLSCKVDSYLFNSGVYPNVKFSLVCKDFYNQGFINVY